jgi:hypothetical protein
MKTNILLAVFILLSFGLYIYQAVQPVVVVSR